MANSPQNFVFDSDFPCDMITYVYSYDETVTESTVENPYVKTIPHNLGYRPLLFGVWATNSDFSDARTMNDGALFEDQIYQVQGFDSYIKLIGEFTSSKHIYVRIYGFAPSTWTGYSPATNTSSNSRLLDSDKSYSKLLFEGAFRTAVVTSASDSTELEYSTKNGYQSINNARANYVTVWHDLGYLPSVMLWADDGEKTYPSYGCTFDYYGGWYSQTFPSALVTTSYVSIETGREYSEEAAKITTHVRIYADE